jgi:hypothetical protein
MMLKGDEVLASLCFAPFITEMASSTDETLIAGVESMLGSAQVPSLARTGVDHPHQSLHRKITLRQDAHLNRARLLVLGMVYQSEHSLASLLSASASDMRHLRDVIPASTRLLDIHHKGGIREVLTE